MTACRAAVLALARPCHQPINRNDIIPTPSQPINSWNMLFAVTKIIMVIRNRSRYLKNWFIFGSWCMYQLANSRIDHVTYSAIGMNTIEYWSNLKLMLMLNVLVFIHCQFVVMVSIPWSR